MSPQTMLIVALGAVAYFFLTKNSDSTSGGGGSVIAPHPAPDWSKVNPAGIESGQLYTAPGFNGFYYVYGITSGESGTVWIHMLDAAKQGFLTETAHRRKSRILSSCQQSKQGN